jgi:serine/threonine-protein kinase
MATTPDVLVDRYEVGRLLGAGGMAEVYEGRDRLLARRVAIKVLLSQFSRDPSFLTRFKREAQSAASLTHPNIVAVYDTGVQAGTNFIVMEYVEGRTLRDVVRSEGPLLPERAAEVAADVCGALAAAHARGIIHRDIKPANIMITTEGMVKVMDFGIARAVTSESITQTAAVVGTAQYISPEQAQATGVDARSDLYSLGVCLYELLTGRVPFQGNTPVAIAYQHVRDTPPPLRQFNPDVPPDLEAVTMKAMAKNPDNRYQTAAEMREDLLRVRSGQGVMATPLLSDQATVAIPPQGGYEHGTSVLSGPMTGTGQNLGYDPYEGRAVRNADPGKGKRALGWVLVFLAMVLAGFAAFWFVSQSQKPKDPVTAAVPTGLEGRTEAAARAALTAAGFTNVSSRTTSSNDVPEGQVIETEPAGGEVVRLDQPVVLVISGGKSLVEVPQLRELTVERAQERATEAKLGEVTVDNEVFHPEVDEGEIVAQNPSAGTEVAEGTKILVTISKGPQPTTTVPTTTTPPTTAPPTTEPEETTTTTTEGDGNGNGNGNGGGNGNG